MSAPRLPKDWAGREVECEHFSSCGNLVRIGAPGTMTYTDGWALHRTKGGTNAVFAQRWIDRHCCWDCTTKLRAGIDPRQLTLFGP